MSIVLALLEDKQHGCQKTLPGPDIKIQPIVENEITVTENEPTTVLNGRARFEARELSHQMLEVTPQQQEKEARAQTPEEIRRKLEAQKNQTSCGRASFTARDLAPI